MGKVLAKFNNGWPGTASRSNDDVIVSLKNAGSAAIQPGAPVFLYNSVTPAGVRGFISGTTTDADFVGFAVRVPDKTADTWGNGSNTAPWNPGDPVDVLVRGSMAVSCGTSSAKMGQQVYIRKDDAVLVTNAGAEGTTVILPDTYIRTPRDSAGCCELTVTKRHLI